MELYLQVFESRVAYGSTVAGLSALCLLLGVAWFWVLYKAPRLDRNRRMLLGMLLFIALLLGLFTVGGLVWQSSRYQTIRIEAAELHIGKTCIPFEILRGHYVREVQGVSLINPQQTRGASYVLVIETQSGRTYTLPDTYYDLPALTGALDTAWEAWRERE